MDQQDPQCNNESVALAQRAAQGDTHARKIINELCHPIISYQTDRFCKRFCNNLKHQYLCSLERSWGTPPSGAPLCEWGNASYGWMLEDLTNSNRLNTFQGKHGARINDYLFHIANSLPFYERWKEWRFGKRLHIPTYIKELNEFATGVYIGLYKQQNTLEIAQSLSLDEQLVADVADQIIITLTRRNKLHLLNSPRNISLTGYNRQPDEQEQDTHQGDIPWEDARAEDTEDKLRLNQAWQQLSAPEQFVLETMVMDEQDATDVLYALRKLDIAISDGVPARDTNRQQLYYFKRKTLAKVAKLMGIAGEEK